MLLWQSMIQDYDSGSATTAATLATSRSPKRKKRGTETTKEEKPSILEYAINPVYKKESESLSNQAIQNAHSTFDTMDQKKNPLTRKFKGGHLCDFFL